MSLNKLPYIPGYLPFSYGAEAHLEEGQMLNLEQFCWFWEAQISTTQELRDRIRIIINFY